MTPTALFPVSFFTQALLLNRPNISERQHQVHDFSFMAIFDQLQKWKESFSGQAPDVYNKFTKSFYLQNWMNDSLSNLLTYALFSTQLVCIVAIFQQL